LKHALAVIAVKTNLTIPLKNLAQLVPILKNHVILKIKENKMNLQWPQLTYLALVALRLGISLAQHGQFKTEKHSFFTQLVGASLGLFLLYQGGFFK
jgi:hypothetical protein